jgi:hypothetical protein
MNRLAQVTVLKLLRGYKWLLSPLLPPACRYLPTCSEFAIEAVERYGAWHGSGMAAWRILRCHPLAAGGYDPVVKNSPPLEGPSNFESPALRPIER